MKKGFFDGKPVKDKKPAPLPAPNSDFYGLIETLPAEELAVVKFDTDLFVTLIY